MYFGRVYVSYKQSVLDPQGEVIKSGLTHMGFNKIESVKQGKYFEIKFAAADMEQAKQELVKMIEALLINANTETYRYDLKELED
ncbi:phosphoribosylformylglycinamidine synthase, purS protein [Fructilactobacillus lindneri]|uniref:Phosphoribosylformylglycinamidine synthase subunit PurS n=1 Tax=Fructilactobacillus lindneri TaxID=53444 RepID=A0AB33BF39_9LACO|nr:phosphoribosylformylglycinamidine synthase subunit PurS [Fructilactobacillus lindneri]ANZ57903.1 phosphoribosylformylglycinamidine synthase [Fructilactobacillus lindneri]ANZ59172.1 phosphoribosylformylglycinamidine synthase [Fructilactobacillus lindneri]POG98222.1 phosphoribosylformylglycinamidine synthase, purS protein [Fructilactobacillus lindneri]POH01661.1 phosphoribosylformylglycinamidine synthase, purS protein [Fructilactobacillus lindneri]POH03504.1 phosphoribosylformylglycinamidine 